jgi:hypothetical protein
VFIPTKYGLCKQISGFSLALPCVSCHLTQTAKKKTYLKAKIEELETNSKLKNVGDMYRGINDFKKGYQPRTNIVKDENGDLVRLPQYFS